MDIFEFQFRRHLPKPIYHLDHIGESASIIYSPFYLDKKIHDAILNQPVIGPEVDPADMDAFDGGPLKWHIRFIPTLCPACGWDLEGHRDSLALTCKNCMTTWVPGKKELKQVKFAYAPREGDNIIHLPFYRIRAKVTGVDLESYADLVKVANLPKAPQPKWADIPFYFWGLAFKIRPQIFLRLAANATLAQPASKLEKGFPKRFHPVNLPVKESVESLKLILATFIKPRPRYFPMLDALSIKPLSYLLVWLPFEIRQHDLVDPVYGFSVNKNALALASNL